MHLEGPIPRRDANSWPTCLRSDNHAEECEQGVVVRGIAPGAVVVTAGAVELGVVGVLQPEAQIQPRAVGRIELAEGHVLELQAVTVAVPGGIGRVQGRVAAARRGELIY